MVRWAAGGWSNIGGHGGGATSRRTGTSNSTSQVGVLSAVWAGLLALLDGRSGRHSDDNYQEHIL